jgi:hypothetical protein
VIGQRMAQRSDRHPYEGKRWPLPSISERCRVWAELASWALRYRALA